MQGALSAIKIELNLPLNARRLKSPGFLTRQIHSAAPKLAFAIFVI
jgi:hypothetical protein